MRRQFAALFMVLCSRALAFTDDVAHDGKDQAAGTILANESATRQNEGGSADDPNDLRVRTTDGSITVLDVDAGLHLQVFDMTGQLHFSATTELGDQRIIVGTSGVYLVQVTDPTRNARRTARVVVP